MRFLDWFYEGIAPEPAGRKRSVESQDDAKSPTSRPSALKTGFGVGFCVALIVFGWGLLLAGLLYVASDDSITTWLLTALLLAAGHVVLAIICWRYAVTIWRQPRKPTKHDDRRRPR